MVKPLTFLKMKKELHNGKICKYKGYKAWKEKETNETVALAMVGKFEGRCGKCGNWGYESAQYPQKNNNAQQTNYQN